MAFLSISAKSKKPVGLVHIEYYRNDSLVFSSITNLDGELRYKDKSFFETSSRNKPIKITAYATGYIPTDTTINHVALPIVIILKSKKGSNWTKQQIEKKFPFVCGTN